MRGSLSGDLRFGVIPAAVPARSIFWATSDHDNSGADLVGPLADQQIADRLPDRGADLPISCSGHRLHQGGWYSDQLLG
ncbi:MAG TPA: hypothetical protein DEA80_17630, partial [Afipia sp.]|nr:hypothetical protein [Afipia sp.]OUX62550.1 MAG: hypothetical protein CBB64_04115 [Afipia sp. TMED4]HAP12685.1 hypothetical protein [Afipia sp.]HAQ94209.1 hypothetical protein [Afipia sp.]HBF56888.1 hypothetical protein [Afipia sp.]